MNNNEILNKIFSTEPLTDELYREEGEKEMNGEGLYAIDMGGIVDMYGREGLFKVVRYCRENGLAPIYKAIPGACDGGTLTFEEQ